MKHLLTVNGRSYSDPIYSAPTPDAHTEEIDMAAKRGMNHPMGPLELLDMIGLDVELAVMETIHRETGDSRYRPSVSLRRMVDAGYLGRKTGVGFYICDEEGNKTPNIELQNRL